MTDYYPISPYAKGVEIYSKEIYSYEKKLTKTDFPNVDKFKETDFALKHNTVKDRVKSILREDKYARKNDFYLCLYYWIKCGYIKMEIDFKDFDKITKPETISRIRRELISQAKEGDEELQYLLDDTETLDKRETLKQLNQSYYSNET